MIGTCINENLIKNMCGFKCNDCEYFVKGFEEKVLAEICMENFDKYKKDIEKVTEKVKNKFNIGDKVTEKFNEKNTENKIYEIIDFDFDDIETGIKVIDSDNNIMWTNSRFIKKAEKKQYLKTWEAIKALEEGKKVRKNRWTTEEYIYLNEYGDINEENGGNYELDCIDKEDEWEIYEEHKKEIPKEFEGLKYLLASINNMNCDKQNCDNCPLGIDNCDTLDDIFFDIKQNYNF